MTEPCQVVGLGGLPLENLLLRIRIVLLTLFPQLCGDA